jgi:uncharacterized protein YycO
MLTKYWIKFLSILAFIRISKYPPFIYYDKNTFTITGTDIDKIQKAIIPGDLILRGFDDFIGSQLIGYYSHIGIILDNKTVIHAIETGIDKIHIYDFCKTDRIKILRAKNIFEIDINKVLNKAKSKIGTPYDFIFDFDNEQNFSCTEFVAYCFKHIIDIPKDTISILGIIKKEVIRPMSFLNNKNFVEIEV